MELELGLRLGIHTAIVLGESPPSGYAKVGRPQYLTAVRHLLALVVGLC